MYNNNLKKYFKPLREEGIMYFSVVCIAIIMGIISHFLLSALNIVTNFRENHKYILIFLPLIGILTSFVYTKVGKESIKGNNLIIESTYSETKVPLRMSFLTFGFTIVTHLFGGSAGREGSAVQIGGVLSNKISGLVHLSKENNNKLIHSGISAGFSSIFGTPLAGAFFGMEMTYIGKIERKSLVPCLLSAYISNFVSYSLGTVHQEYIISQFPQLSIKLILVIILSAILFGIIGMFFSISIKKLKYFYSLKLKNYIFRALISSVIVVCCFLLFNAQKFEGLSLQLISSSFQGKVTLLDPITKFVMTVLTLSAGFQGGEVTPLFAIGSSMGGSIGNFFNLSPSLFAGLGMISVFGCATNTPITTIMIGIDLFGAKGLPYFVIVALVSYTISGHNSIYSSQKIGIAKFSFLKNHEGLKISEI